MDVIQTAVEVETRLALHNLFVFNAENFSDIKGATCTKSLIHSHRGAVSVIEIPNS